MLPVGCHASLSDRFGLFSTIQQHAGKPMIKIAGKSIPLFRSIVTPHFHQSLLYKLDQNRQTKLRPL